MAEIKLEIDGMHCGACVRRVTQALNLTEGVAVEEVRVGSAKLTYAQEPAPVEAVIATLAKIGFAARVQP
jgi:copper chaperone